MDDKVGVNPWSNIVRRNHRTVSQAEAPGGKLRRRRGRKGAVLALGAALVAEAGGVGAGAAAAPAPAQRVGIPAYFYPAGDNLPLWDRLRAGAPTVSTVIATGLRLADHAPDTNYQSQISATRQAGVRVLAYVTTSGGGKPAAAARDEISRAFSWYDVDGIFFDEAVAYPVTCGQYDYYRSLHDFTKAQRASATTVMNHGQILPECYASAADVLMNAEMDAASYRNSWRPWGWEHTYPASKFWHLVHSAPTVSEMESLVALTRERNAGTVFVTSATRFSPGGPYGSLPPEPYWSAQLTAVSSAPTSPTTAPPTTAPPTTAPPTTAPPTAPPTTRVRSKDVATTTTTPWWTTTTSPPWTTTTTTAPPSSPSTTVRSKWTTTTTTPWWSTTTTQPAQTTTTAPATTSTTVTSTTVPGAALAITGFTPTSGPPGSYVRIDGRGFTGAQMVTLDGGPVKITNVTEAAITVRLNSWNTSGRFWVMGADGSGVSSEGAFTVLR